MKIIINEHPRAINFELVPENQAESNQLLRLASNCRPGKVEFWASFAGNEIQSNIHFDLFNERRTSIRNSRKR